MDGKPTLILDGTPLAGESAGNVAFSPDGTRLAYSVVGTHDPSRESVVVDGVPGPEFDGIGADSLFFSPDGSHVVYAACNGAKWSLVVDGKPGPEFDAIRLTFDSEYLGVFPAVGYSPLASTLSTGSFTSVTTAGASPFSPHKTVRDS